MLKWTSERKKKDDVHFFFSSLRRQPTNRGLVRHSDAGTPLHNLEEQMTQQQCNTQKSCIGRAKQTRLQFEVQNSDICEITSIAADPKTFRNSITLILMMMYHSQTTITLTTHQNQLPWTRRQWICEQIYTVWSIFNWSFCFRDGDGDDFYSKVENQFDLDLSQGDEEAQPCKVKKVKGNKSTLPFLFLKPLLINFLK